MQEYAVKITQWHHEAYAKKNTVFIVTPVAMSLEIQNPSVVMLRSEWVVEMKQMDPSTPTRLSNNTNKYARLAVRNNNSRVPRRQYRSNCVLQDYSD